MVTSIGFPPISVISLKVLFCLSQGCQKSGLYDQGLTHYQTPNFRLFRTESVCRQKFRI